VRLGSDNVSGLTINDPRCGPAILVNLRDDPWRQHFSVLHEFGHVLMDQDALRSGQDGGVVSYDRSHEACELRANGFAGGMLLPDGVLIENWKSIGRQWKGWRDLLAAYKCNYPALFYGLADLRLMPRAEARELVDSGEWRIPRAEKADTDLEGTSSAGRKRAESLVEYGLSMDLIDAVSRALAAGTVSWAWAARRLRIDPDALRALLNEHKHLRQRLPSEISVAS
jgi:Zn-dependent peptidase ImmA (M78 family)